MVAGFGAQFVESRADLRRRVTALGQPRHKQAFFNVAVAAAVGPVANISVAQLVAEEGDDPILRGALGLADVTHARHPEVPNSPSWSLPHGG